MKKSRETFKTYEGEIKNMNQRAQELTQIKKKLQGESAGGKKKKGQSAAPVKDYNAMSEETDKIQAEWEAEKTEISKEIEEQKLICGQLQEQIKALKATQGKA